MKAVYRSPGREKRAFVVICLLVALILLFFVAGGLFFFFEGREHRSAVPEDSAAQVELSASLAACGVERGCPVFLRIIKETHELEVWMKPRDSSAYVLVRKYPVQAMSGQLGPKTREGDMQAPEGFYRTYASLLNPNSKYHLSFNIGYPNAYDKALGRTGSFIMVHGSNKSLGCFAMGDPGIEEIYSLVESYVTSPAGRGGVPVHVYPFVPTPERLAAEKGSPHYDFWCQMARGWEWTERHRRPVPVRFEGKDMLLP